MIRKSLVYASSGIAIKALGAISGIVLRRLVAPAEFGIWSFTQVIVDFMNKFDVGCDAALLRDLPLERGRGGSEELVSLQATGVAIVALQGALSAAGVLLFWWVGGARSDYDLAIVWFGAAAMLLLLPIVTTGQTLMMAHGHFDAAGYLGVALSLSRLAGMVVGAALAGVTGIIGGAVSAAAFNMGLTLWLLRRQKIAVRPGRVSALAAGRLLRFGIPIRFFDYPSSLFLVVDTLAVAALYDSRTLAIYGTARLGMGTASDLAGRFTAAERNDWRVRMGEDGSVRHIAEGAFKVTRLVSMVVWPILACGAYLAMHAVIHYVIPDYADTLPTLRILFVAWVFLPHAYGIRDGWVVQANFRALLITGVSGLFAFAVALSLFRAVPGWPGTTVVAQAYLASAVAYMLVLLATAGVTLWGWRRTLSVGAFVLVGGIATWSSMLLVDALWNWWVR